MISHMFLRKLQLIDNNNLQKETKIKMKDLTSQKRALSLFSSLMLVLPIKLTSVLKLHY